MDDFVAQEPDEGYSEDPLNPTATQTSAYLAKPRSDASRSNVEFPDWLTRHIAGLTVHDKTRELASCPFAFCDRNNNPGPLLPLRPTLDSSSACMALYF
jgi:hypothetical protein